MLKLENTQIGIIGLGYVGLPLAVEFGKRWPTWGFDINEQRIQELESGFDATLEVDTVELQQAKLLNYTKDYEQLAECNTYIVTVPTPIDDHKQPDLKPLKAASEIIAKILRPGNVVIYESTVYPGATEEICIPILEHASKLRLNQRLLRRLQSGTHQSWG